MWEKTMNLEIWGAYILMYISVNVMEVTSWKHILFPGLFVRQVASCQFRCLEASSTSLHNWRSFKCKGTEFKGLPRRPSWLKCLVLVCCMVDSYTCIIICVYIYIYKYILVHLQMNRFCSPWMTIVQWPHVATDWDISSFQTHRSCESHFFWIISGCRKVSQQFSVKHNILQAFVLMTSAFGLLQIIPHW